MRIAVVLTSTRAVDPSWTTVHLVDAMLRLGHTVRLLEPGDLEITAGGRIVARAWCFDEVLAPEIQLGIERLSNLIRSQEGTRRYINLDLCDLLLVRVNPLPSHLLQLLSMVEEAGVPVINRPSGLARTRGKAWLATLPDVPRPTTLVTTSGASARAFAQQNPGRLVVKPATGSGGRGVKLIEENQLDALEIAVKQASLLGGHAVVQTYLPEAEAGEKRLFWVAGALLGGYLRNRASGEFRHNLKQGAQPLPCQIEAPDRALAAAIGPHLMRNGILVAGLDVIGGSLVEVNTLNPGGVHWSDHFQADVPGRIASETIIRLTRSLPSRDSANLPSNTPPEAQPTP